MLYFRQRSAFSCPVVVWQPPERQAYRRALTRKIKQNARICAPIGFAAWKAACVDAVWGLNEQSLALMSKKKQLIFPQGDAIAFCAHRRREIQGSGV
jgi:hypothetical protein